VQLVHRRGDQPQQLWRREGGGNAGGPVLSPPRRTDPRAAAARAAGGHSAPRRILPLHLLGPAPQQGCALPEADRAGAACAVRLRVARQRARAAERDRARGGGRGGGGGDPARRPAPRPRRRVRGGGGPRGGEPPLPAESSGWGGRFAGLGSRTPSPTTSPHAWAVRAGSSWWSRWRTTSAPR